MLKEVEMAPCCLSGIIGLDSFSTALRTTEDASRSKVYLDVKPLLFDIE